MMIGIVLIVIGVVFFAKALEFISADTLSVLWPLLLIVLGLSLISHKLFGHHDAKGWWSQTVDWNNKAKRSKR